MFIVFDVEYPDIFLQSYRLEKRKMNGIGPGNLIDTLKNVAHSGILLHYDTAKKTLFSIEMGEIKSYQTESLYFSLFYKYLSFEP